MVAFGADNVSSCVRNYYGTVLGDTNASVLSIPMEHLIMQRLSG